MGKVLFICPECLESQYIYGKVISKVGNWNYKELRIIFCKNCGWHKTKIQEPGEKF